MNMKRFFLYFIVIAALALAGCGGGGGGVTTGPVDPPPPPSPTPDETALKEAQDAAMAAYTAAMEAVGGAKDYVAMQNAQEHADMAKEASDAAQAATTSAMAEEYQMQAEAARDAAQEAAMMRGLGITKLANKITNQSDIDNAILQGTDPDDPVSNAKRVGAALGVSAATTPVLFNTPEVTGPPLLAAVTGGTVHQGGQASARATYSGSGTMVTAGLPTTVDAVSRGETPTPLMTRGGWMGAELVGTTTTTGSESTTYANVLHGHSTADAGL